jgi:sodium pump decarboxylase gamma subunit
MVVEGIKLAISGMFIVYIFLVLLVLVVHLSSRLLRSYTQQEVREQAQYRRRSSAHAQSKDDRMIAVISAAIAAHRRKLQS